MHDRISVNNRSPMQFQLVSSELEHRYLQLCWYSTCKKVTFKTLNPKVQGSTP